MTASFPAKWFSSKRSWKNSANRCKTWNERICPHAAFDCDLRPVRRWENHVVPPIARRLSGHDARHHLDHAPSSRRGTGGRGLLFSRCGGISAGSRGGRFSRARHRLRSQLWPAQIRGAGKIAAGGGGGPPFGCPKRRFDLGAGGARRGNEGERKSGG